MVDERAKGFGSPSRRWGRIKNNMFLHQRGNEQNRERALYSSSGRFGAQARVSAKKEGEIFGEHHSYEVNEVLFG